MQKKYFAFLCCSIAALQFLAATASADHVAGDGKDAKETYLEQIVVTATRTEKDLESVPGSVSVITKDEIQKRNITTIDEALNTTPGVVTTRGAGLMDRMAAISLQGIPGQSRTLIMMDGITLNSPYAGTFLSLGAAPGSLERVEVVKGPFSSLYGGYAMGGVVNMITRMPRKREFTLQSGYGSALDGAAPKHTRRVAASYGDSFRDKFRIFIHNDYLATDGYRTDANIQSMQPNAGLTGWSRTTDAYGAVRYLIGDKGMNGAREDNLTVKTEGVFSAETKIRFSFLKSTGKFDYGDPQTYLRDSAGSEVWSYGSVREDSFLGTRGGSDQYVCSLGFETEISPARIKLDLGYMDQAHNWNVIPTTATATRVGGPGKLSDTPAAAWNADLQLTVPLYMRNLLTFGGSFRNGQAHSREHNLCNWRDEESKGAMTYESKGEDRTFALFIQDEIALVDSLTAYIGFRQDWWETFDGYANQVGSPGYPRSYDERSASSFSPKGAIVYRPLERTTFNASVGQAFRAPTMYELYRTWTTSSGTTYAGNPDLKPETTTSWDFSVEQETPAGGRIKATYFENYISNLIYSTSTTDPQYKSKANAGKAESKGVELEVEQMFGKLLRVFANYTYTDATIKENSAAPASVGKRMTAVPEQMFNVGSDLECGPFGAYLVGRYVGKRYGNDDNSDSVNGVRGSYDPYITVDLKLRYKVVSWATVSFSVNNLLDEQYYSLTKAPGRSWFGEVTLTF